REPTGVARSGEHLPIEIYKENDDEPQPAAFNEKFQKVSHPTLPSAQSTEHGRNAGRSSFLTRRAEPCAGIRLQFTKASLLLTQDGVLWSCSSFSFSEGNGLVTIDDAEARLQTGPAFVGRRAELEAFDRALDALRIGRGGIVLLLGQPGIGKTRIASEFASRAEAAGFDALWGNCQEQPGLP